VSKRKLDISRRDFIGVSIGAAAVVTGIGCGSSNSGGQQQSGAGGQPGGGGASTGGKGTGTTANGGAATGGTPTGAGGAATGGTPTGAGGAATGGASPGTGGAATGGTPTGAGGAATGGTGTKATGGAATGGVGTGGTSSTGATALVSMVRGTDWVQATQDAIAAAGGLPDLSGKKVMLRINAISSSANSTTSPDVIKGVILAVQKASKGTAPTITVGEDGWNTGGNTLGAMQTLGITAVCTATGATPMDLSKQTYTTRTNANALSYPNGVSFSDPVYNADYVIAIPICKTHGQSRYTMAFKLWYGNVPTAGRLHPSAATFTAPPELYLIKKADFVVLDATKCMTTGGPDSGTMAQSKIVVASKDAIAADVTGLCILKYNGSTVLTTLADAWTINQVARALALKFPGWLAAKTNFPYVSQGVTEAATIMGY